MIYVCGFAFNEDKSQVALVLKNRPAFLAGKFNGIGGKVEPTDNSVTDAMIREFEEEAWLKTDMSDWTCIGNMFIDGGVVVHFFVAVLDNKRFEQIRTNSDEFIHTIETKLVLNSVLDQHAKLFILAALTDNVTMINVTVES